MPAMFETIVGTPVEYETIHIGRWTQRLLLATGYGERRVFIAGDAAHLVIPTGGLGMNTGVGDAIDLAWKLAATLQGWGGPGLLPSYEIERRQVGARNVAASGYGTDGRKKWRAEYRPWIEDSSPKGEEARRNLVRVAAVEAPKSSNVVGAELGYRYVDSPIIVREPGEGPPHRVEEYVPTTWPGARLPHVWIKAGEPVHDRIGDGYTLLRLGSASADAEPLARAFAAIGAPFEVLDIREGTAREVYGFDYLLLRPDLHVVWRGNSPPDDPERLARMVTGHETTNNKTNDGGDAMKRMRILVIAACAGQVPAMPASAQSVADFYKGKTVQMQIGFGPGASYDLYGRLVAEYIGRYIPGNPQVVSMNMEGAGSLRVVTWLYNIAPKDGTVIATASRAAPFAPLLGAAGSATFEAAKFTWIGSANNEVSTCVAWGSTGITSLDQLREHAI